MASISTWRTPVSSRNPKTLMAVTVLALLTTSPALTQESCGKLYQNQDCGAAEYEEALARQKEMETTLKQQTPPEAPVPGGPAETDTRDMRQRALDLYRARAAAMANSVQCCHPGVDGTLWCH